MGRFRVDCPFNSDHNRDAFVGWTRVAIPISVVTIIPVTAMVLTRWSNSQGLKWLVVRVMLNVRRNRGAPPT